LPEGLQCRPFARHTTAAHNSGSQRHDATVTTAMLRILASTLYRLIGFVTLMSSLAANADSSGRELASYYERHMLLASGVAYGWVGQGAPRRLRAGVAQVGVGKDSYFALLDDGTLLNWTDEPDAAAVLMRGVSGFAAGHSGWFAIDRAAVLWHAAGTGTAPRRVADEVVTACIGDSADYYITRDGRLFVQGLAHRGQYGDGRLIETTTFVATASNAVAVKAHTGHAIHLTHDGTVMGTGGNRFGPLSAHGLGDKAERWGHIFDGASAITTGSRHSAAIRADGSLWAWGQGFRIEPTKIFDKVSAVAAGDTAIIALTTDGALWQWDAGGPARRLTLP
jgi:Regulator of chromosome condensation (RCC1) repeat